MPAKSAKQERFMRAVAENPKFAKKVDVSQSVGKEYIAKARGGYMKYCSECTTKAKCKAANKCLGGQTKKAKMGGKMKAYKAGGKIDGCAMRGKTRGKIV
jgi:hypothetical protein